MTVVDTRRVKWRWNKIKFAQDYTNVCTVAVAVLVAVVLVVLAVVAFVAAVVVVVAVVAVVVLHCFARNKF